jgi:methionine aminopeptidase
LHVGQQCHLHGIPSATKQLKAGDIANTDVTVIMTASTVTPAACITARLR